MTHDRELERLLDSWLTDGPTVVADRVIDGVASRIVRQPQRPAWRLRPWRFPTMSTQLRLAIIAGALLIATFAGGLLLLGGGGRTSPTPSVAPTAAPSPIAFRAESHLAAARYATQLVVGRLTFALPAGWSSADLSERDFTLHLDAGPIDDTVKVFTDMRRASKDAACTEDPQAGVGATADLLAQDLIGDPNLVVTQAGSIDLDGRHGRVVDVSLAPGTTRTCPFSNGQPTIPLIVDTIPGQGAFWGIGPDKEKIRLIIVDALPDHNVVIALDSAAGTSFDALVNATMQVVGSFTFEAGDPLPSR